MPSSCSIRTLPVSTTQRCARSRFINNQPRARLRNNRKTAIAETGSDATAGSVSRSDRKIEHEEKLRQLTIIAVGGQSEARPALPSLACTVMQDCEKNFRLKVLK